RFFLNWATVWRRNFTPDELKVRLNTDPHAPANFRAIGAPSNMPAFPPAFGCNAGDAIVRDADNQVVIWYHHPPPRRGTRGGPASPGLRFSRSAPPGCEACVPGTRRDPASIRRSPHPGFARPSLPPPTAGRTIAA